MVETLRPDQRLRDHALAKRHGHPEVLSPHRSRRAARALQAAARGSVTELEDQRKRLLRARTMAALRGGVRGGYGIDEHQARALVRYSIEPQVVPQSGRITDHR